MPIKETATLNLLSPKAMFMNFLYFPLIYFLNQHGEQLLILISLMIFDFITGIMKSRRLQKKISRYKLETGFYMKLGTLLLPFLFVITAKGVGYEIEALISFSIGIFIVIEFYSIIGNIYTLRTGSELEDKDFLSFALLSVRAKTEQEIEQRLKDKGEDK